MSGEEARKGSAIPAPTGGEVPDAEILIISRIVTGEAE